MTEEHIQNECHHLQQQLKKCFFSKASYTGQIVFNDKSLESANIYEFFVGKRWEEITLDALQNDYIGDPSACFSFMTPAAKQYYLPAYIFASLTNYYEADLIVESTIRLLGHENWKSKEEFSDWLDGFSTDQKYLIGDFASFLNRYYAEDFENQEVYRNVLVNNEFKP